MSADAISVTLTRAQWDVVAAALGELPLRVSMPVFVAINKQMDERAKKMGDTAG